MAGGKSPKPTVTVPKHVVLPGDTPPDFISPAQGKAVDPYLATVNKARLFLAMRIREQGSNRGKMVEYFQKTVDGKAEQEPWCAAFGCTVLHLVATELVIPSVKFSEHCQTFYNKNALYQRKEPKPGFVVIWKRIGTSKGHFGICETEYDSKGYFSTIEGNTSPSGTNEGDGVYRVKRHKNAWKGFEIMGFIDPWVPSRT